MNLIQKAVLALSSEPWSEVLKDPAFSFVLFGIAFVYFVMALMWRGVRAGQ